MLNRHFVDEFGVAFVKFIHFVAQYFLNVIKHLTH